MCADDLVELELMLNRFQRLLSGLIRADLARNCFQPWEVEILLDIENCTLDPGDRLDILRRYQKAVEKQMETGPGPPMKLSEFLQLKTTRRPAMRKPPPSTMRIASG
jgi:hypothetical protein